MTPAETKARQQRAADTIATLWQRGEVVDDLPPDLKPTSRAEGYAIQAKLDGPDAAPRVGWKIAATSIAGQKHIGVDGPLAGRILADMILPDGATVSLTTNRMRVAEPEFAFRFVRDLPPRAAPYAQSEVMSAVADLHLALELPDSRFADFAHAGGPTLIAEAACARELVLGPAVAADWRSIDLARHVVRAHKRGLAGGELRDVETRDGIGANVLGDPRIALTWIVNELSAQGIGLRAGEFVTTGACVVPVEIGEGDQVRADFGVLGSVSVVVANA